MSLEMCICTHFLVVDHIGCSICVYQSHIAIFFSMLCSVHIYLSKLERIFGFHNHVTLEGVSV